MLIGQKMNKAINEQVGREFGASLQYIAIAATPIPRYRAVRQLRRRVSLKIAPLITPPPLRMLLP